MINALFLVALAVAPGPGIWVPRGTSGLQVTRGNTTYEDFKDDFEIQEHDLAKVVGGSGVNLTYRTDGRIWLDANTSVEFRRIVNTRDMPRGLQGRYFLIGVHLNGGTVEFFDDELDQGDSASFETDGGISVVVSGGKYANTRRSRPQTFLQVSHSSQMVSVHAPVGTALVTYSPPQRAPGIPTPGQAWASVNQIVEVHDEQLWPRSRNSLDDIIDAAILQHSPFPHTRGQ